MTETGNRLRLATYERENPTNRVYDVVFLATLVLVPFCIHLLVPIVFLVRLQPDDTLTLHVWCLSVPRSLFKARRMAPDATAETLANLLDSR